MDQTAGTPADAVGSPPSGRGRRRWFRFSLRTLVIFVLLAGSAMGLWFRWEPWYAGRVLVGHRGAVYTVSLPPDGLRIISGGADRTVRIWDAETGAQLHVLEGHTSGVWHLTVSPDGQRLVTNAANKEDTVLLLWNVENGERLASLAGHTGRVNEWARFSLSGDKILSSSDDQTARIWDGVTGKELAVLRSHKAAVHSAAFSPDGRRIATRGADHTVRLWDADTGAELAVLRGHNGSVGVAEFSPDGRRLVTSGGDLTVHVWDVETGRETLKVSGCAPELMWSARFSRDGRYIHVHNRFFDATTGEEVDAARAGRERPMWMCDAPHSHVEHNVLVYNADGKLVQRCPGTRTA
jgi:WD40 repeat protein